MLSSPIAQIDGPYLAGEIVLLKDTDPQKTCLLVEGIDDEAVYKHFVSLPDCHILISYGNENLMNAIRILDEHRKVDGYLGIKDADFDIINNTPHSSNIVFTDGHDLEVMICNSAALDKFVEMRLRGQPNSLVNTIKTELREKLFGIGATLGYLRWLNHQYSWEIDIHTFKLLAHLNDNCELAFEDSVSALRNMYPTIDEQKCILSEFETLNTSYKKYLCNGHELIKILANIFLKVSKRHIKKKVNPGEIVEQLYLAYDYLMFRATSLFNDIQHWETINTPHKVLV